MAREINRLSARTVATLSKVGRHSDGGNLYLVVDKNLSKRWVFLFRWNGKLREKGLGSAGSVTLARARELAAVARSQMADGIDPIAARKAEPEKVITFGQMADDFIETMKPQFRNAKHIAQWEMTLTEYAADLRELPIDGVTTDAVLKVLKPIWQTKPETASRLRGRIERVLDAAKAKGLRTGENPALWRGHLVSLLPKRQKLSRGHHAALPYKDLPAFMRSLKARPALSARALEFTILTAARSGETYQATWAEIDLKSNVWTVPGYKMKGGREHRVPLSDASAAILKGLRQPESKPTDFVFPGGEVGKPLSSWAMEMLLRRMKAEITTHGFRSTFRDWCGEETEFPRELAEAALAHVVGDETERAYRRGDALAKRRKLMDAWETYCTTPPKRPEDIFD